MKAEDKYKTSDEVIPAINAYRNMSDKSEVKLKDLKQPKYSTKSDHNCFEKKACTHFFYELFIRKFVGHSKGVSGEKENFTRDSSIGLMIMMKIFIDRNYVAAGNSRVHLHKHCTP